MKKQKLVAMASIVAADKQDAVVGPAATMNVVAEVETSWFKPKKGSVYPAKRRLVKKMMFDEIVHFILSCFGTHIKRNSTNRVQPN